MCVSHNFASPLYLTFSFYCVVVVGEINYEAFSSLFEEDDDISPQQK